MEETSSPVLKVHSDWQLVLRQTRLLQVSFGAGLGCPFIDTTYCEGHDFHPPAPPVQQCIFCSLHLTYFVFMLFLVQLKMYFFLGVPVAQEAF